jgi:hypothetical protein
MNKIQQEAEKRYPYPILKPGQEWFKNTHEYEASVHQANYERELFIAGATYEGERAKGLVEALRGLVDDVRRKPNDTRYATHLKIAEQALKTYQNE